MNGVREVDYVVAGRLKTIVSYRTHRITATDARLARAGRGTTSSGSRSPTAPPTTRAGRDGQGADRRLYAKYLDRAYTTSIWSERGRAVTALSGRVALVTGASHGTGADIAHDLARAGVRVAVQYRSDRAAGEAVAAAIRAEGGEAEAFAADVARAEDVRRLVAQVREGLARPASS